MKDRLNTLKLKELRLMSMTFEEKQTIFGGYNIKDQCLFWFLKLPAILTTVFSFNYLAGYLAKVNMKQFEEGFRFYVENANLSGYQPHYSKILIDQGAYNKILDPLFYQEIPRYCQQGAGARDADSTPTLTEFLGRQQENNSLVQALRALGQDDNYVECRDLTNSYIKWYNRANEEQLKREFNQCPIGSSITKDTYREIYRFFKHLNKKGLYDMEEHESVSTSTTFKILKSFYKKKAK